MKTILSLILTLFLFGCATKIPQSTISSTQVNLDSSILVECPILDENPLIETFEDVIVLYSKLGTLYAECANKQSNSIKLLKQFGGIK